MIQDSQPNFRFPKPGLSSPGSLLAQLSQGGQRSAGTALADAPGAQRESVHARPGCVSCDQAIFSSVRSALGQGYRIVAASKGLSQTERRDITARSPSHEGLCVSGPDALGFASYVVSSGRWCVAFSCTAGAEHTGRGGDRVFTRIVTLTAQDMARFGYDPCLVLEAMTQAELCRANLELPANQILPPVELQVPSVSTIDTQTVILWQQQGKVLSHALDRLLDDEKLLVVTGDHPTHVAVGLIRSLPAPRRQHLTVSCNLRFSVSRAAELNLIPECNAKTESLIRGQKVRLIDFSKSGEAATANSSVWVQLTAKRWQLGRAEHWIKDTARIFEGYSRRAAEEWAELLLAQEAIFSQEAADILGMLRHRHELSPSTQPAREALVELRTLAGKRLELLAKADAATSIPAWYAQLYAAYRAGHATVESLAPAVTAAWNSLAQRDELLAVESALNLAESIRRDERFTSLEPGLTAILQRLVANVNTMEPTHLARVPQLMESWTRLWPDHGTAKDVLAAAQKRLLETSSSPK